VDPFSEDKEALGLRKLGPVSENPFNRGYAGSSLGTSPSAIFQEKSQESQPALVFAQFSPIDFSFHDISPRTMIRP
jgi:hypothetical protein